MKKCIKMIVAWALVVIMGFISQESFLAGTYNWQIIKTPGKTDVETSVTTVYTRAKMTYELKSLTGTCTYVAAKVRADAGNDIFYYFNVPNRAYLFTKPATQTLALYITELGALYEPNIRIIMSIENNSTNIINETLTSTGTITVQSEAK